MSYERFSQLWDALITDNPNVPPQKCGKITDTMKALIEYGEGKKSKINAVRKQLGR